LILIGASVRGKWGISIGLIAATIFLFGLAARVMPILTAARPSEAH